MIDTRSPWLAGLALSGALAAMGIGYGPIGAVLPELFATAHRYSGASMSYSLGACSVVRSHRCSR